MPYIVHVVHIVGLAGKTDLEQAQVDMIVDCIGDMKTPLMAIFREKDEAKKVGVDMRDTYTIDKNITATAHKAKVYFGNLHTKDLYLKQISN